MPNDPVKEQAQERIDGRRDRTSCASETRNKGRAEDKDVIGDGFDGQHRERNPHCHFGTGNSRVHRHISASCHGSRQTDSVDQQEVCRNFCNTTGGVCQRHPHRRIAHQAHTDDGKKNGEPNSLVKLEADSFVMSCTVVVAGDRRKPLHDAD